MPHVVDVDKLIADGILDATQAAEIVARSRATMMTLAVNTILTGGIIAAALGLVFWIADPMGVALVGLLLLGVGPFVIVRAAAIYRMFGSAAVVIGAGMLLAGSGIEVFERDLPQGGLVLAGLGAGMAGLAFWALRRAPVEMRFPVGCVLVMTLAYHGVGLGAFLVDQELSGWGVSGVCLYFTALFIATGLLLDTRLLTALAIVPFAQALDTGTLYFHAAYVFYSPESTLTILQMGALVALCLWLIQRGPDRIARHATTLALMAAIVGNLAFLVGSLFGDMVGQSFFMDQRPAWETYTDTAAYNAAVAAWEAGFLTLSEGLYSWVWAVLLAGAAWMAAVSAKRGLFNAAVTFGAIHAYTQIFESFSDVPMVYALGGLGAVGLAWGMWRLNQTAFGAPSG